MEFEESSSDSEISELFKFASKMSNLTKKKNAENGKFELLIVKPISFQLIIL